MNNKPPNLSALYDFYRYASGGIVPKKAKPVGKEKTVPTALDWGPNAPMDYLAYLNKQEMALIQKHRAFKGKRSHEGIPAFPDPGTTGYGDKGQGTTSSSGLGGGNKSAGGNTSGVGGGGGGGGGASGSRGSSTGSVGAGNGANAGAGQGGQDSGSRGAGSNYGPGSGRPTVGSSGGSGPTSPMSGQGQSFRSPMGAGWANRDIIDKQRSEVQNARGALQSTSALKTDLQVGGIRSLSVGPMGTTVNVGPKPPTPAAPQGMFGPRTSVTGINYMKTISQPGFITSGMPSTPSGLSTALPEPKVPMAVREYNPYDIRGARQPYGTERIMGVETVPNETLVDKSIRARSIGLDNTNPYDAQIRDHIEAMNQVAAKNAAMNYGGFSLDPEQDLQREAIDRGLSESVMNASLKSNVSQPESTDTVSADGGRRGAGSNYGPGSGRPGIVGSSGGSGPTSPNETIPTDATPSYVDPITQQPAYPEKRLPMKIAEHLGIIGRGLKLANWADRKMFDRMTPEQQAAAMERWSKQRDSYGKNAGTDNDRGEEFRPPSSRANESTTGTRPTKPKGNGPRPAIYYKWDMGVDVPSPTDSDYTLYTKYLQEKAAARAGFA